VAQGSLVKKGDRYYGVFYVGPKQVWRALKSSVEREAHSTYATPRAFSSSRHAQWWDRRVSDHPRRRHWSDVPEVLAIAEQAEHEAVARSRGTGRE